MLLPFDSLTFVAELRERLRWFGSNGNKTKHSEIDKHWWNFSTFGRVLSNYDTHTHFNYARMILRIGARRATAGASYWAWTSYMREKKIKLGTSLHLDFCIGTVLPFTHPSTAHHLLVIIICFHNKWELYKQIVEHSLNKLVEINKVDKWSATNSVPNRDTPAVQQHTQTFSCLKFEPGEWMYSFNYFWLFRPSLAL